MNYIFTIQHKALTPTRRFKKSTFLLKFTKILKFFKKPLLNKAGRNNTGTITIFSKGIKKKVNTTSHISNFRWDKRLSIVFSIFRNKNKLLTINKHITGSFSIHPHISGVLLGQRVFCSVLPKNFWVNDLPGSFIALRFLPKFTIISNIYIFLIKKYALANGTFSQIIESFVDFNLVKILLPSKTVKFVSGWDFGYLGRNSQINHKYNILGKAGLCILFGNKSKVRGVARNPVDHPHGGRTKTNQPEVSIWGWVAKKNK